MCPKEIVYVHYLILSPPCHYQKNSFELVQQPSRTGTTAKQTGSYQIYEVKVIKLLHVLYNVFQHVIILLGLNRY